MNGGNLPSDFAERYKTGPYIVAIYQDDPFEYRYEVEPDIQPALEPIIERIKARLEGHCLLDDHGAIPKLQGLIESRMALARSLLKEMRVDREAQKKVTQLAAFKSLHLDNILPLLIDDRVEEIFLDCPSKPIYIDHRKWGRCRTNIVLPPDEISAIKTRLCSESGYSLDISSPSLKTEVLTNFFHARFTVDIAPLAYSGLHLDVRKLRLLYFTLPELIANGSITAEACAYLYYCLVRRRNICVIGEPNAGKTTLINALDILTPPHWRKLTIEDVIESIPQSGLGFHQVRFKVAPMESITAASSDKGKEVVKLLHRAPDYIYLGEIQTPEHSRAMFHALSCGLRGLETCHALSPKQALRRWVLHHRVQSTCIYDLDTIVCMSRMKTYGPNDRKVVRICEVDEPSNREGLLLRENPVVFRDTFLWDPFSGQLKLVGNPFDSPVLRGIRRVEAITSTSFKREFSAYVKIFKLLSSRGVFSVDKNVEIFRNINIERMRRDGEGLNWSGIVEMVGQLF